MKNIYQKLIKKEKKNKSIKLYLYIIVFFKINNYKNKCG